MGKLDRIWIAFLMASSLAFCIATGNSVFLSSVLLSGSLCVALIAIGRKEGYLVGLYNSCAYAWVAYQNGLFGEVMLNLIFFLPTGVAGYLMWRRHAAGGIVAMRAMSGKSRTIATGVCLAAIGALGWGLGLIPTQNTPYVDASTNVLSVIATVLMMWRYKEQWLLYMALNVLSVIMWVLRWRADGVAGDMMVVMWTLYLANSIFGYWRWSAGVDQIARSSEAA